MTGLDDLGALIAEIKAIRLELRAIGDRLNSWDRIYRTRDGRETHQLQMNATTWEGRRRDDRDRGYDRR